MTFIFVLMAQELAKCIHRKLNVADFQCNQLGKYTLNVNIYSFIRLFLPNCCISKLALKRFYTYKHWRFHKK